MLENEAAVASSSGNSAVPNSPWIVIMKAASTLPF